MLLKKESIKHCQKIWSHKSDQIFWRSQIFDRLYYEQYSRIGVFNVVDESCIIRNDHTHIMDAAKVHYAFKCIYEGRCPP